MGKLTKERKETLLRSIVNEAYPSKEYAALREDLIKEIRKHPYVKKGIDIAKRYPDHIAENRRITIISGETLNSLNYKVRNILIDRLGHSVDIDTVVVTKYTFSIDKSLNELSEKGKYLFNKFIEVCKGESNLKENVNNVLSAVNTEKQLVELIPEAAKFLDDDSVKTNAIIPKESIDLIRNSIKGVTDGKIDRNGTD